MFWGAKQGKIGQRVLQMVLITSVNPKGLYWGKKQGLGCTDLSARRANSGPHAQVVHLAIVGFERHTANKVAIFAGS